LPRRVVLDPKSLFCPRTLLVRDCIKARSKIIILAL
jgi:hypothetical protein